MYETVPDGIAVNVFEGLAKVFYLPDKPVEEPTLPHAPCGGSPLIQLQS